MEGWQTVKNSRLKDKLRILEINDAYEGGGAEVVFQKTARLLKERGHSVHLYADKKLPKIESKDVFRYIFSFRQQERLKNILEEKKPDIVHIHNFYHYLSPSILRYLMRWKKEMRFKIAMTIHDYHFLCANNGCVRWKGDVPETCEDCRGRRYHKILFNRCDPRGFSFNILKFLQHFVSYNLFHFDKGIDLFIVPSLFLKNKLHSFCGEEKAVLLHNPAFDLEKKREQIHRLSLSLEEDFESIYIGRIDAVKGLMHFISQDYDPKRFGKFLVVGDGDLAYKKNLVDLVREKGFIQDIRFLGRKSHLEALSYLFKAKRLVFPSIWYENCPLVVLEARLLGKEVFHYGLGSIEEILSLDEKELSEKVYVERLLEIFSSLARDKEKVLENGRAR